MGKQTGCGSQSSELEFNQEKWNLIVDIVDSWQGN